MPSNSEKQPLPAKGDHLIQSSRTAARPPANGAATDADAASLNRKEKDSLQAPGVERTEFCRQRPHFLPRGGTPGAQAVRGPDYVEGDDADSYTVTNTNATTTHEDSNNRADSTRLQPEQSPPLLQAQLVNTELVEAIPLPDLLLPARQEQPPSSEDEILEEEPGDGEREKESDSPASRQTKNSFVVIVVVGLVVIVVAVVVLVVVLLLLEGSSKDSSSTTTPSSTINPSTSAPTSVESLESEPPVVPMNPPQLLAKLTSSDAEQEDHFGYSVSVSSDTIVVGAHEKDEAGMENSGSVYVFVQSTNNETTTSWTQQAKLTAYDGAPGDRFGQAVSISGNTVAVGSSSDMVDPGAKRGAVYIFVRDSDSFPEWNLQAKLNVTTGQAFDYFGSSLALQDDTLVVGAHGDSSVGAGWDSGSAYIFVRDPATEEWSQQTKLTPSDPAANRRFGYDVSISGDTVVVGSWGNSGLGVNTGGVYVFSKSGAEWRSQQEDIQLTSSALDDDFGHSVSVSQDTILVGAYGDDPTGTMEKSGSTFVFSRSGGTTWAQQAKLVADDSDSYDYFGYSVSIRDDVAVIGSKYDNDAGPDSGSIYIFTRSGSDWYQHAKLVAGDWAAGDEFGLSVSMGDGIVAAGAIYDDDEAEDSGSAYVFGI